ncbi:MAG: NifU family protein [Flavobacteriales bacterium]|jgi:Fe-S cluster biogenesis protein NfuA|nr:NifU family protein [Flavobacteriales bacterium]MDP7430725.1 NifU family protein [Flavobacteriales bacterium]HJN64242.1 NifU family protein [Flavobacteriales bacterium]|tara:strand:- start:19510 stop:19764 length:255 start_codon:yes stop_codon:yes gene_type:complete
MGIITDRELLSKIEGALDEVRPYLEADGGDINLVEVTNDMVVKVKLMGACSSCNVSMMTMKSGVEQAIKRAVPEIKEVIDITSL